MSKLPKQATTDAADKDHPSDIGAVPPSFGEGNDYWNRYYELAQKQDAEGRKNMAAELDTLLIFGALFSAVSTAFVIYSLPMLSPAPSDETNNYLRLILLRNGSTPLSPDDLVPPSFTASPTSVRVNSFFIASLSCSVISTFGAMLGKRWLAYAERSRHGGSVRYRALQLQKRLSSANRWGLSIAFQVVSMLLQIAVTIFLIGLTDLLWSTHRTPAWFSLSLSAAGVVLYSCTLFAVWLDPYAPFQTQFLTHHRLRLICRLVGYLSFNIIISSISFAAMLALAPLVLLAILMTGILSGIFLVMKQWWDIGLVSPWARLHRVRRHFVRNAGRYTIIEKVVFHPYIIMTDMEAEADTVEWLLEHTTDEETALTAMQNAMALQDFRAVTRLSRSFGTKDWVVEQLKQRLKRKFEDSAVPIFDHTFSDAAACKILIKALAHVCIGVKVPMINPWEQASLWVVDGKDLASQINTLEPSATPSDMDDITLFKSTILSSDWEQPEVAGYLPLIHRVDTGCLRAFLATLFLPFGDRLVFYRRFPWIIIWFGRRRQLAGAATLSLLQRAGDDRVVLNLVSWALNDIRDENHRTFNKDGLWGLISKPKWLQKRWEAYSSDEGLIHNFTAALAAYLDHITHAKNSLADGRLSIMFNETYIELLEKFRVFFADPKAAKAYTKDLKSEWPNLLGAMEKILLTTHSQSLDVEPEGRRLVRREVLLTMDALWPAVGRPNAEVLLHAGGLVSAEDPDYLAALLTMMHLASSGNAEDNLELLAAQASTVALLVSALTSDSDDIRRTTISTLSTHSAIWFPQPDTSATNHMPDTSIMQNFRNALPHALATSIRLHRDWPSISTDVLTVLGRMFEWPKWRSPVLTALCDTVASVDGQSHAELDCLTEASVDIWLKAYHASTPSSSAADSNWTAFVMLPAVSGYLLRREAATIPKASFKEYLELMKTTPSSDTQTIVELLDGIGEVEPELDTKS